MILRTSLLTASLTSLVVGLSGCASDKDPVAERGAFESDSPGQNGGSKNGSIATADAATPTANGGAEATGEGEAARAIEEADIVKIEGTRLYALSQYGGLSVIDISVRDHMRLLGRKKVQAQPFEMYVRDSVVFALYNGYGEYVKGAKEGSWTWVNTSYVMAFDTTNPTNPVTIGRFSIPGTIQDSRIVGDVMYVVGYESNGCWGCAAGQHTTVISLNITTPSAIAKVAERSYADDTTTSYSWKRSISVTDKRMYIAGPEWSATGAPVGSEIQVVDISDPTGTMVDGAKVSAAGRIDSRWQMDETGGVLRVISQPGNWRPQDPPRIQTFDVASAQSVTPLASVAMTVPLGEDLRSVRFDGPRGYAITAIQTDPLYTIDLANAAQPKQVGELAMPGWIYFMEPRGERLVSLGYDQGNAAGALAVSLFDVSNLATPTLLDRVSFGGNWSWISEDQDRVHKAFQVLDASNLILMPFSGYSYDSSSCWSGYQSGVQLIDWSQDQLTLQGVAPTVGQARRGFLYDNRLFAMSDERVEAFDIADRSQPKATDKLKLTEKVERTLDAGTAVVKIGQDWYNTNTATLETTTLDAVESTSSTGQIDVKIGQTDCNTWSYLNQQLAHNGKVYLLTDIYRYDSSSSKSERQTQLTTVDVSNPTAPKVLGDATLNFGEGWSYWWGGATVTAGESAVMAGDAIVALGNEYLYTTRGDGVQIWAGMKSTLNVIDPTDPSAPKMKSIQLSDSYGTTGLLVSGTSVALGYYLQSPSNPNRVRFYVARLDVSDPSRPVQATPVNVPGSPVAYDATSGNVVSVDYREIVSQGVTFQQCRDWVPNAGFEYPQNDYSDAALGTCRAMQHTLYLVHLSDSTATVLGSKTLPIGKLVTNVAVGDDRVFLSVGTGYYYSGVAVSDCFDCGGVGYGYYSVAETDLPLYVVGGLESGDFAVGNIALAGGDYWSYAPMVASGKRVLLSTGWRGKLAVIDGTNVNSPVLVRQADVNGSTQSLTAIDGIGIASMYFDGVQTIPIKD